MRKALVPNDTLELKLVKLDVGQDIEIVKIVEAPTEEEEMEHALEYLKEMEDKKYGDAKQQSKNQNSSEQDESKIKEKVSKENVSKDLDEKQEVNTEESLEEVPLPSSEMREEKHGEECETEESSDQLLAQTEQLEEEFCSFCSKLENADSFCPSCPAYPLIVLQSIDLEDNPQYLLMIDIPSTKMCLSSKWTCMKYFLRTRVRNYVDVPITNVYSGRFALMYRAHFEERLQQFVGLCQRVPQNLKRQSFCNSQLVMTANSDCEVWPNETAIVTCTLAQSPCLENNHMQKIEVSRLNDFLVGSGQHREEVKPLKSYLLAKPTMHIKIINPNPFRGMEIARGAPVFYTRCCHNEVSLNELFNFTFWESWRINTNVSWRVAARDLEKQLRSGHLDIEIPIMRATTTNISLLSQDLANIKQDSNVLVNSQVEIDDDDDTVLLEVSEPPCSHCDDPTIVTPCPNCPKYEVVLTQWNDGHGCWVAKVDAPSPSSVSFVKLFKDKKLVNSPGLCQACIVDANICLLIIVDPPTASFKAGTSIGSCQMTSVPYKRCNERRLFFASQTLKCHSNFVLEVELKKNEAHQECYNQRHLQRVLKFDESCNGLQLYSRHVPIRKTIRMSAHGTALCRSGEPVCATTCADVKSAVLELRSVFVASQSNSPEVIEIT